MKFKRGHGLQNKKILVHLHLYYQNQINYFIKKLKNITCEFDLIVTLTNNSPEIIKKIKQFKSGAKILVVENLGYDVYPFIQAINETELKNYDYILKIHTKNKRKEYKKFKKLLHHGFDWRNLLVSSLIGSKKVFNNNLKLLENEKTGMVSDKVFIHKIQNQSVRNFEYTNEIMQKFGCINNEATFAIGTMFLIKREIVEKIKSFNFTKMDFISHGDKQMKTGSLGQLAHAMEAFFGAVVADMGYEHIGASDFWQHFFFYLKQPYYRIKRGIFSIEHKFDGTVVLIILFKKMKLKQKKK